MQVLTTVELVRYDSAHAGTAVESTSSAVGAHFLTDAIPFNAPRFVAYPSDCMIIWLFAALRLK